MADSGDHGAKVVGGAKGAFFDFVEDLVEAGVNGVGAVVVGVAEVFDVFREVAEEEDIVLANFAGDFNLEKGLSVS